MSGLTQFCAVLKKSRKNWNRVVEIHAEFYLVGMRAQRDKVGRRTLPGDDTGKWNGHAATDQVPLCWSLVSICTSCIYICIYSDTSANKDNSFRNHIC
jgi:hypothetical protein